MFNFTIFFIIFVRSFEIDDQIKEFAVFKESSFFGICLKSTSYFSSSSS